MLHRTWPAIAVALLFAGPLARAGEGTEKGAATPKDLMVAAGAALAKGDLTLVKGLICEKGSTPEVVELYANLLHVDFVFASQKAEAVKVFGKDIAAAVDAAGGYLAKMHIDFAKLAEQGKLEKLESGETKFSFEDEKEDEGESYSVDVVELDGHWYLDSQLPKDPAEAKMMLDLVRAMVPASQKLNAAIKAALPVEGGDPTKAEKFREVLKAAGEAFHAELTKVGEPADEAKPKDGEAPPKDGAEPPKK